MAAEQSKDAAFSRRLLALAEIYDAGSRSDATRNGGVGLQTIRDWVRRSNTWGPDGLKDCKASGRPSRLKDEHRRAVNQMVEQGPNPAMHGVVRWRLTNLALLWYFWFSGSCKEHFTVRASQGRRPYEEVEDGLPDGRHARLWRRSCDSFFSVPLL